MYKIGDRVGAILSADSKEVRLLGYGKYAGSEIPPKGITLMGVPLAEFGIENPKILLDDGKVVWGCECWWGPEDKVKNTIGKRRVVMVDIEKERVTNG
jgi:hypothetical protein